jgi:hypothetical protein
VTEALRRQPQRDRRGKLLAELDAASAPVPGELAAGAAGPPIEVNDDTRSAPGPRSKSCFRSCLG